MFSFASCYHLLHVISHEPPQVITLSGIYCIKQQIFNFQFQKASKILGLDPQQSTVQNFATGGADSGRFSLGSRTSSSSSPILFQKKSKAAKKTISINAKEREDEIVVLSEIENDEPTFERQTTVEKVKSMVERQTAVKQVESGSGQRLKFEMIDSGSEPQVKFEKIDLGSEMKVGRIDLGSEMKVGKTEPRSDVDNVAVIEVVVPVTSKEAGNGSGRLKEEDRAKFKSLGDLHIEKGLPAVPV
jgi:hypothetical protein